MAATRSVTVEHQPIEGVVEEGDLVPSPGEAGVGIEGDVATTHLRCADGDLRRWVGSWDNRRSGRSCRWVFR